MFVGVSSLLTRFVDLKDGFNVETSVREDWCAIDYGKGKIVIVNATGEELRIVDIDGLIVND